MRSEQRQTWCTGCNLCVCCPFWTVRSFRKRILGHSSVGFPCVWPRTDCMFYLLMVTCIKAVSPWYGMSNCRNVHIVNYRYKSSTFLFIMHQHCFTKWHYNSVFLRYTTYNIMWALLCLKKGHSSTELIQHLFILISPDSSASVQVNMFVCSAEVAGLTSWC